jgi:hypothetical protein
METGETPTQKQGRLARLQFVVDRVRRIQHLAMLILLVMIALTLISSDHASKQFGVGESSTESTTTITVQIQLASLTPVEITLNDAGVYDVEGFACITGDTLFINGAPLPCAGAGTECTTVLDATAPFSVFRLTGITTAVVPRACATGGGYGIELRFTPR